MHGIILAIKLGIVLNLQKVNMTAVLNALDVLDTSLLLRMPCTYDYIVIRDSYPNSFDVRKNAIFKNRITCRKCIKDNEIRNCALLSDLQNNFSKHTLPEIELNNW